MTNLDRINQLNPIVACKAKEFLKLVDAEGIKICIVQGLRSIAEQNALYAQGRTKPGPIVTNARGGQSYHNYGLALDYCLLDDCGNLVWNEKLPAWTRVAEIGKSLGFSWGGDWTGSLIDYPHLEMSFGLCISDLLAGKCPPTEVFEMDMDMAKFVNTVLQDYWGRMTGNQAVQDYTHSVAVEFRKAAGIPEESVTGS